MKLKKICDDLGIKYDFKDIYISGINTLKESKSSDISFLDNKKYIKDLKNTKACAVLLEEKYKDFLPKTCIALISDEPYLKLARMSKYFAPKLFDPNAKEAIIGENSYISKKANIGKDIIIGKNVNILDGAFIGDNTTIGDNTIIYPNVSIYRDTKIGKDCIIHSGTVIGSDGFGFAHTKDGKHIKLYQNGNVIIEDDVEIGANSCVDRATFGSTIIKEGVRIDNLVQIAHNCNVGEYSIVVAQAGIAGSVKLGRNAILGGQSAIVGHLNIAPFTSLAGKGALVKNVDKEGQTFGGTPAIKHIDWLKLQVKLKSLLKNKS